MLQKKHIIHQEDVKIHHVLVAPSPEQRFRLEPSPRRIRVVFGGATIVDCMRVMLLLQADHLPVYYFPRGDVQVPLERTTHTTVCPLKGPATYYTVRVGDRVAENAAWSYDSPPHDGPLLQGYVAFYWREMDAWYQEDERALAHARDPYKLVDVLPSSRHVRLELGGVVVAESSRPQILFETGLPARYYLPREDVLADVLIPSDTISECPYKGLASYFSARVGGRVYADVFWTYREPLRLGAPIAGLIGVLQERMDAVWVNGVRLERPISPWVRRHKE